MNRPDWWHLGQTVGGFVANSSMWQPLQFAYLQVGHRSDSVVYSQLVHIQLYMAFLPTETAPKQEGCGCNCLLL